MIGFVEKIINDTTVLVRGLSEEKTIEITTDKFTVADFKELINGEELIIVSVNENTKEINEVTEL